MHTCSMGHASFPQHLSSPFQALSMCLSVCLPSGDPAWWSPRSFTGVESKCVYGVQHVCLSPQMLGLSHQQQAAHYNISHAASHGIDHFGKPTGARGGHARNMSDTYAHSNTAMFSPPLQRRESVKWSENKRNWAKRETLEQKEKWMNQMEKEKADGHVQMMTDKRTVLKICRCFSFIASHCQCFDTYTDL